MDRFIPKRLSKPHAELQQHMLTRSTCCTRELGYRTMLEETLFDGYMSRSNVKILNFSTPFKPSPHIPPPTIIKKTMHCYKILDLPNFSDNFYINVLAWSNKNILAVGLGEDLAFWNGNTETVMGNVTFHGFTLGGLDFSPHGEYLASGLSSGDVHIHNVNDIHNVSQKCTLPSHDDKVAVVDWQKDNVIVSGYRNGRIHLTDMRHSRVNIVRLQYPSNICNIRWSPDRRNLAIGLNDNLVSIWDERNPNTAVVELKHEGGVKGLDWCSNSILATGGGLTDRHLRLWDIHQQHTPIKSVRLGHQITSIVWNKVYREIAVAGGELGVFTYPDLQQKTELIGHTNRVLSICSDPNQSTLVSASSDETMRFWSKSTSKKRTFEIESLIR